MRRRRSLPVLIALATLAITSNALAQQAEGFALDRFDPSERGSQWFVLDSLDIRGHGRPAIGVVGDWGYKPLVTYDANGDEVTAIVEHQLFAHVGGSVNLWDSLRLGVNLPFAVYKGGKSESLGDTRYRAPRGSVVGDLRLTATLRLLGTYGDPFTAALGVAVFVPTGTTESYTGDGRVRAVPALSAAGTLGNFVYAAKAGVDVRPNASNGFGAATGSELQLAASLGYQSSDASFVIGPEVFASSVLSEKDAFLSRTATPVEALLGAHVDVGSGVRLGAGAGTGLTRGYGSPQVRVVGVLEWMLPVEVKVPPKDTDGDGIFDDVDACPETAGVASDDPKKHGCPPPPPEVAPPPPPPPPKDSDEDGIIDEEDACPTEKGPKSTDPKKNGCPLPKDTDGDGILDEVDACPTEKGKPSNDPKKNGCPDVIISQGQIRILEQVKFATGKAIILPESEGILSAVLRVLNEHSEIEKVRVEGHTDNRGAAAMNKKLSAARAASVVKWLVGRGCAKERLISQGFGPDKPIESNETEEGRRENRRVEFHIVEEKK